MPVTYRVTPGTESYPGATLYPGVVGAELALQVYIDLGDPTDPSPNWQILDADVVRSFSIARGRESELADMNPGTATITVDNRNRDFDPSYASSPFYPYVRPMTRFRLTAELDGVEYPMFVGYAEAYEQQWPAPGFSDAVTTISLVDEFKVLNLDRLPTTDPPRDSYSDVVMFDEPAGYWHMDDESSTLQSSAAVGPALVAESGLGSVSGAAGFVVGEQVSRWQITSASRLYADVDSASPLNPEGLADGVTIEVPFKYSTAVAAARNIASGPHQDSGDITWQLALESGGGVYFAVRNVLGSTVTANSTTALAPNTWYHLVGAYQGGAVRLYVNGVEEDSAAQTNTFGPPDAGAIFYLGDLAGEGDFNFDEVAFYRTGLTAGRILAHYTAGRQRGFSRSQLPGARITSILDESASVATRSVGVGVRAMTGEYMTGQAPLDSIRNAVQADNVDAMFFAARDGTVTYLDASHRSVSPYNTVQATFDDDGTDLPYVEVTQDYNESFLVNEWNVTRTGGTTATASDATSIGRYFKRPQSITDMPIVSGESTVAAAMLAKYKDPMERIPGLLLTTADNTLAVAALSRDLGDRIRIFKTKPGGARLDQTSFIQKIEISGDNSQLPWTIRWGVSPV